ncbi:MAG: YkvA family protein [Bacillus sp. (in: firmicutes)]
MKKAEKNYSEERFWDKLKKYGEKAGTSVVYAVLLLYYTLQKPEVPAKTKAVIIGALGYFILPIDLIPDFAAGIGFTDDLGALGIALLQVAIYIDGDVRSKAKHKLTEWFGAHIDTTDIDSKIVSNEAANE